jgi:hypothetical protein
VNGYRLLHYKLVIIRYNLGNMLLMAYSLLSSYPTVACNYGYYHCY